jgi:hypothetical protein
VAPAERYRTNKRKGRDKEAVRFVTGGEAKKFERCPEQIKDTTKRKGKLKTAIWSVRKRWGAYSPRKTDLPRIGRDSLGVQVGAEMPKLRTRSGSKGCPRAHTPSHSASLVVSCPGAYIRPLACLPSRHGGTVLR